MAAHNHVALLLLPLTVQSASACSSMISQSPNIRWLKRFAAVEARSSHRAMVWREWPVTRAVAAMLTPSTRRLATWVALFHAPHLSINSSDRIEMSGC